MKSMRSIFTGLLATMTMVAMAQHGYLGARNMVSLDIHDKLFADAWSFSYTRCLGNRFTMRGNYKMVDVDRDLFSDGAGWLFAGKGRKVGAVAGTGAVYGLHFSAYPASGLSAPVGYFMSIGFEYYSVSTIETMNPSAVVTEYDPQPLLVRQFDITGFRLVYEWGVRQVITGDLTVEVGAQMGVNIGSGVMKAADGYGAYEPNYLAPYENTAFLMGFRANDEGQRSPGSLTLTPMLGVGYLF